jgi:hypothetical protein
LTTLDLIGASVCQVQTAVDAAREDDVAGGGRATGQGGVLMQLMPLLCDCVITRDAAVRELLRQLLRCIADRLMMN